MLLSNAVPGERMWVRDCVQCAALWKSYEDALADQMAAMDRQHRSILDGRDSDVQERELHLADQRRAEARKRIAEHRWAAHSKIASAPEAQPSLAAKGPQDGELSMARGTGGNGDR